jgi:hypothetical protein
MRPRPRIAASRRKRAKARPACGRSWAPERPGRVCGAAGRFWGGRSPRDGPCGSGRVERSRGGYVAAPLLPPFQPWTGAGRLGDRHRRMERREG